MPLRQPNERECQVCGRRGLRSFTFLPGVGWLCVNKRPCSDRKHREQARSGYTGMHSL